MTLNLYVMPITGSGTRTDPRRPKYFDTVFPAGSFISGMYDYGDEPWCVVGIQDIDTSTNTTLTGEPDVIAVPANLDAAIGSGAALTRTRNALESVNMPGTWIQATNTWRDVARFVGAVCQFAQRYQGSTGGLWFTGGITLASWYIQLPTAAQNGLSAAATSFGFDTSGITGTTTVRAILLSAGQQYLATQPPLILASTAL